MKILGILLSTFILIGCEATPPVEVKQPVKKIQENKEKNRMGIMTMSCLELDVVLHIAESDRVSLKAVQSKLRKYVELGKCGIHRPRIPIPLETLIDEYVDFMGVVSQVWKVKNLDLWTILAKDVIVYEERKKENKKTPGTSI
jgi:hypothetical protein